MLYAAVISLFFTMTIAYIECSTSSSVWIELLPDAEKEKLFATPEDLRSHLNNLSHYYAVIGRPRFGKRNLPKIIPQKEILRNFLFEENKYGYPFLQNFQNSIMNFRKCLENVNCRYTE